MEVTRVGLWLVDQVNKGGFKVEAYLLATIHHFFLFFFLSLPDHPFFFSLPKSTSNLCVKQEDLAKSHNIVCPRATTGLTDDDEHGQDRGSCATASLPTSIVVRLRVPTAANGHRRVPTGSPTGSIVRRLVPTSMSKTVLLVHCIPCRRAASNADGCQRSMSGAQKLGQDRAPCATASLLTGSNACRRGYGLCRRVPLGSDFLADGQRRVPTIHYGGWRATSLPMGADGQRRVPTAANGQRRAPTSHDRGGLMTKSAAKNVLLVPRLRCQRAASGADGPRRGPTVRDGGRRLPTGNVTCLRVPTGSVVRRLVSTSKPKTVLVVHCIPCRRAASCADGQRRLSTGANEQRRGATHDDGQRWAPTGTGNKSLVDVCQWVPTCMAVPLGQRSMPTFSCPT